MPSQAKLLDLQRMTSCPFGERWKTYRHDVLQPFAAKMNTAQLFFVAAPTRCQLEAIRAGAAPQVALNPQERLSDCCRDLGLGYIELADAFDAAELENLDRIYLNDDVHFSPEGHRLIADFLWSKLNGKLAEKP